MFAEFAVAMDTTLTLAVVSLVCYIIKSKEMYGNKWVLKKLIKQLIIAVYFIYFRPRFVLK